MGRRMVKVVSNGQMGLHIRVYLLTIKLKVMERMNGMMGGFIQENGKKIRWRGKGNLAGRMVESIKENIGMIKKMGKRFTSKFIKGMGSLNGLMEKSIRANGRMANNTDLEL
jgi:hypothetical protein